MLSFVMCKTRAFLALLCLAAGAGAACTPASARPRAEVAVARRELAALAPIDATTFEARWIPAALASKGVLRFGELQALRGQKLPMKLRKGGILLRTMLSPAPPTFRPSSQIAKKLRAVTLPAHGLIATQPGDVVDFSVILHDESKNERVGVTLAQRATVIAAGDAEQGASVAVLPKEAALLLLAAQSGQLQATVRNATDTTCRSHDLLVCQAMLLGERGRSCQPLPPRAPGPIRIIRPLRAPQGPQGPKGSQGPPRATP